MNTKTTPKTAVFSDEPVVKWANQAVHLILYSFLRSL